MCVPTPAIDGQNVEPLTPVPDQVPPLGVAVIDIQASLIHVVSGWFITITGKAFTVIDWVVVPVQPDTVIE